MGPVIGAHAGPGLIGVTALRHERARPDLGRSAHRRSEKRAAMAAAPTPMLPDGGPVLSTRIVLRVVVIVTTVVLTLYLIYLLRQPLTWIFIAGFLAIALSGPVNCPPAPHAARASRSRSSTSR